MTDIIFNLFPGHKKKALTMSYDDGTIHDRRLVEIFNKYGIRGTFHLNSGRFDQDGVIRADEVAELQRKAGRYDRDMTALYAEKWNEILAVLGACPTAAEIEQMLLSVGFDLAAFERMYGADRIADGKLWSKDLKDRYSILWLYFDLFGGIEA